jgi:hypothetical protein
MASAFKSSRESLDAARLQNWWITVLSSAAALQLAVVSPERLNITNICVAHFMDTTVSPLPLPSRHGGLPEVTEILLSQFNFSWGTAVQPLARTR